MSLSEITDPRAVHQAIAEFDQLSRDEFLRRYGFGRSLKYFVVHDGRRYDSKAILGAAHGYQYPDRKALGPGDFNGGEAQTVRKLRTLGFLVVNAEQEQEYRVEPARAPRYWALVANPRTYDVEAALNAGAVESWSSRDRPMRPGDGVILWRTRGSDGNRGVVAIGEVTGEPFKSADNHDPFWIDPEASKRVEHRVPLRFSRVPGLPLWMGGSHSRLLNSLSVARARGGTVFQVSPEEWSAIRGVLGADDSDVDALVEEIASPLRRPTGQGRALSAPERRVVELHAMTLAISHYEKHWKIVKNVASTRCYDLECRTGNRLLRVEVKGTTGDGASVLLTANEVEHARDQRPHVALFVVSRIQLQRDPDVEPVASGGTIRIFDPWEVNSCELRPTAFECRLP